jgi:hypothetical protein
MNKEQPLTEVKTTDNQRTKNDPKKRSMFKYVIFCLWLVLAPPKGNLAVGTSLVN